MSEETSTLADEAELPLSRYQTRMAKCRSCAHARRILGDSQERVLQCKLCNCIMNLKNRLPASQCPIGLF